MNSNCKGGHQVAEEEEGRLNWVQSKSLEHDLLDKTLGKKFDLLDKTRDNKTLQKIILLIKPFTRNCV